MKDAIFVSHLVKLLPGDRKEEVESKPTAAAAAACFLDKEIKPAVESGENESFDIMLSVMIGYGSIHLQNLAKQIKQEIEKKYTQRRGSTGKNIKVITSYHTSPPFHVWGRFVVYTEIISQK